MVRNSRGHSGPILAFLITLRLASYLRRYFASGGVFPEPCSFINLATSTLSITFEGTFDYERVKGIK